MNYKTILKLSNIFYKKSKHDFDDYSFDDFDDYSFDDFDDFNDFDDNIFNSFDDDDDDDDETNESHKQFEKILSEIDTDALSSIVTKYTNNNYDIDTLIKIAEQYYINNDYKSFGAILGVINKKQNINLTNAIQAIRSLKYYYSNIINTAIIPLNKWIDFTIGYNIGTESSDYDLKEDLVFTKLNLDEIINSNKKMN